MCAHPRSRGENTCPRCLTDQQEGSSPLTRGKRLSRSNVATTSGLIPAHAGKTSHAITASGLTWAHPRSRGENPSPRPPSPRHQGSSPLTRGKLRARERLVDRRGLIPAHAGKTTARPVSRSAPWAHPRSRGENHYEYAKPKTSRAHPRSRGENIRPRLVVWENVGSSPLTRGKLVRGGACLSACGLIPAHAGKTGLPGGVSKNTGAHPRSRGENRLIHGIFFL